MGKKADERAVATYKRERRLRKRLAKLEADEGATVSAVYALERLVDALQKRVAWLERCHPDEMDEFDRKDIPTPMHHNPMQVPVKRFLVDNPEVKTPEWLDPPPVTPDMLDAIAQAEDD